MAKRRHQKIVADLNGMIAISADNFRLAPELWQSWGNWKMRPNNALLGLICLTSAKQRRFVLLINLR